MDQTLMNLIQGGQVDLTLVSLIQGGQEVDLTLVSFTRGPCGSNPGELDTRGPSGSNPGKLDTRGPSGFPGELGSNPGEVDTRERSNLQGSGSEVLVDNLICHSRVLTDAEKYDLLICNSTDLFV